MPLSVQDRSFLSRYLGSFQMDPARARILVPLVHSASKNRITIDQAILRSRTAGRFAASVDFIFEKIPVFSSERAEFGGWSAINLAGRKMVFMGRTGEEVGLERDSERKNALKVQLSICGAFSEMRMEVEVNFRDRHRPPEVRPTSYEFDFNGPAFLGVRTFLRLSERTAIDEIGRAALERFGIRGSLKQVDDKLHQFQTAVAGRRGGYLVRCGLDQEQTGEGRFVEGLTVFFFPRGVQPVPQPVVGLSRLASRMEHKYPVDSDTEDTAAVLMSYLKKTRAIYRVG